MRLLTPFSLLFLSLLSSIQVFSQDNVYCLDSDKPDFAQYELFNEDIEEKKIIIIGEMHYMEANYTLQPDLLIHLNKHFGLRHLLIEFGRAEAYLYNRYLKTGDLAYLDKTFSGLTISRNFSLEWKGCINIMPDLTSIRK
jgi:hypothetical protein